MTTNTLRNIKVFAILVMINFTALAGQANGEEARELIRTTSEQVITRVIQDRESLKNNPRELYHLINTTIVPHIDFRRMSRWVLGKNWRRASLHQQEQFMDEFRKLMIRTYSTALVKFSDEEIIFLPIKEPAANGRVTVRSEVRTPDGQRFKVDYRMHNKDKGWKVYDISVDGVSLVSTYRSSFATEIRRVGLDGLLTNLVDKNQGLNI